MGDITYIPLVNNQWAALAVWMDLFSGKIIGWQLEEHMQEALITEVFKKSLNTPVISDDIIIYSVLVRNNLT
ncbi:MAG: DDE-type integrase/transposase/recombinase [Ginsengibacter sp.]